MADTEDMDPQYRWILPTYLEPTQFLLDQIKYNGESIVSPVTGPPIWLYLIAQLGRNFDNGNPKSIDGLQNFHGDMYSLANEEYQQILRDKCAPSYGKGTYTKCKMALLALQHIGLDVHGGINRLVEVRIRCVRGREPFPMTSIIVVDPEKASKYVNIGINLEANISLRNPPTTLGEAAENYSKISKLVKSCDDTAFAEKDIDKEVEERIGIGKKSHLDWEFAREKFRLQTLKRFKDALIAKAGEEKASLFNRLIRP